MDLNGDGKKDLLAANYSGVLEWVELAEEGFGKAQNVVDKNGDWITLSKYWGENESWSENKAGPNSTGQCTSAAVVDWDDDGDSDLILGSHSSGKLFLRVNEGSVQKTAFSATDEMILVGEVPAAIQGGVASIRIADWNRDGLFDIICGGLLGGVFLFENSGKVGLPKFGSMTVLVEPLPGRADGRNAHRVKRVGAKDDQPVAPGSSFHIEVVDYDDDGDLDLLVGGQSVWLVGPVKVLSDEQNDRVRELEVLKEEAQAELAKTRADAGTKGMSKMMASDEYKEQVASYMDLVKEHHGLTSENLSRGDFVWLFRRK